MSYIVKFLRVFVMAVLSYSMATNPFLRWSTVVKMALKKLLLMSK